MTGVIFPVAKKLAKKRAKKQAAFEKAVVKPSKPVKPEPMAYGNRTVASMVASAERNRALRGAYDQALADLFLPCYLDMEQGDWQHYDAAIQSLDKIRDNIYRNRPKKGRA